MRDIRKISRTQTMFRSDVYGTDVINDGVTISTRKVSVYRDRLCGKFNTSKLKYDCSQYAADAESTGVK